MNLILLPRAGGKTTRMVEWLLEDDRRVLIVPSEGAVAYVLSRVYDMDPGIDRARFAERRVFTPRRFQNARQAGFGFVSAREVGVDDLGQVLQQLLGASVSVATDTHVGLEVPLFHNLRQQPELAR